MRVHAKVAQRSLEDFGQLEVDLVGRLHAKGLAEKVERGERHQ